MASKSFKRSMLGFLILLGGLIAIVVGLTWSLGLGRGGSAHFRLLGPVVVFASIMMLALTVDRWAGYFFALCLILVLRGTLSLITGTTRYSRHAISNYALATELVLLWLAITALTYQFTVRLPRSKLEKAALVGGLVGLSSELVLEPNTWPLRIGVLLLAVPWLADFVQKKSRHGHVLPAPQYFGDE